MDTVRLKFKHHLPVTDFFKQQILSKDLDFELPGEGKRYVWTNQAWRKARQAKGLYTPKYGIEQNFSDSTITYFVIEFSVPKLLFGENLTELNDGHLTTVTNALHAFFKEIGIFVITGQVLNTIPTLVAFGKNINLTRICTCSLAIKALSPFDYLPHARHQITEYDHLPSQGREIIFSIPKTETFKFYSKTQEVMNAAKTSKEVEIANALRAGRYNANQVLVLELLRAELTLKTGRKIKQRLAPYLALGEEPNFQNIFKKTIWDAILKDQVVEIFNHPLRPFIFLAQEDKPRIEAFLEKNLKHIETKDTARGIIASLQEYGLAQTRQNYLQKYNSRQSWYNYLKRLEKLRQYCDFSTLAETSNCQIHRYILSQFGIDTTAQGTFNFEGLSKKLDVKPRNTTKQLYSV